MTLSSTDAPSRYWTQGKLYFIMNSAKDKFLHWDEQYDDYVYATDDIGKASFLALDEARNIVVRYKDVPRSDFERGQKGLKLFRLLSDAQIGVLVYKARDLKLTTHLEIGD